ncbi:uncharacterized protein ACNLHF_001916 [Anomaloglossus baeobatrachus]
MHEVMPISQHGCSSSSQQKCQHAHDDVCSTGPFPSLPAPTMVPRPPGLCTLHSSTSYLLRGLYQGSSLLPSKHGLCNQMMNKAHRSYSNQPNNKEVLFHIQKFRLRMDAADFNLTSPDIILDSNNQSSYEFNNTSNTTSYNGSYDLMYILRKVSIAIFSIVLAFGIMR